MKQLIKFIHSESFHLFIMFAFIILLIFLILLTGCMPKPTNEMEEMSRDVLKAKKGIEIIVEPLPDQK